MKTPIATVMLALSAGAQAECTELLGYSQTKGVYTRIDQSILQWQARVEGGATLRDWMRPDHDVWDIPVRNERCERSEVTHVVLSVSDHPQELGSWIQRIEATIQNIRDKYLSVQQITLQPVVGGPGDGQCIYEGQIVRATSSHPTIDAACLSVAQANRDVVMGLSPEVQQCSDYSDSRGHLTATGSHYVADQMEAWYGVPRSCRIEVREVEVCE